MLKIAFIVPPFLGHTHPTLGVGKELILRGHQVYWLSMLDHIEEIMPEGGNFIKVRNYTPETASDVSFGMESLRDLYEKVLVPLGIYMYNEIKPRIKSADFDLIVTDHQAFAGAILAHEFNIPYVTSVTAPAAIERSKHFPEVINYESDQIVRLQKQLGIDFAMPLVCASPLTLVYSTTEFLQTNDFPSTYHFVGPSITGRKEYQSPIKEIESADPSKPKVLITLGSILKCDVDFIDTVVEAFKDEKVTIILVADPALRDDWPNNFLVYPYIPQLSVLKEVQAVICHAGYNTVCEALSLGLPLITLPVAFDQSYIGTKVALSGAGLRLKYRRLKSHHLKDSLNLLLSDPKYKAAAKRVQNSFIKAGGTRQAAHLIEEFAWENIREVKANKHETSNINT